METSTKVMIALGIVSGLGVVSLSLNNNAVATEDVGFEASVDVANAIALDANAKTIAVTPGSSSIATNTTTLTCASNSSSGYQVTVQGNETVADTHKAQLTGPSNLHIPSTNTIGQNVNAWAVKTAVAGYTDTWQAIPDNTGGLQVATKGSASTVAGDSYTITWGITASTSLVSGQYEGDVVFTISSASGS